MAVHWIETKTDSGQMVTIIGLQCDCPTPAEEMLPIISPHMRRRRDMGRNDKRALAVGFAPRSELDSAIAIIPITRTSVFWRIGRSLAAPLYARIRTDPYHLVLSEWKPATLNWRAAAPRTWTQWSRIPMAAELKSLLTPKPLGGRKYSPL